MNPPTSSSSSSSTSLNAFESSNTDPLLPPRPLSPRSSTAAANPTITRRKFQTTTTSTRTRRNLYFGLILLGILIITVRLWDTATTTQEEAEELVESKWKSRLNEWREWATTTTTMTHREGAEELGWGWEGSTIEEANSKEKEETTKGVLITAPKGDEELAKVGEQEEHVLVVEGSPEEKQQETETTIVQEEETIKQFNVNPFATSRRTPSGDDANSVKYLAYDNHSGFHNQRKSLVNALILSKLLNRTLLLPPARLGNAIPWGPEDDLPNKLVFSEECKKGLHEGLPVAKSTNSHLIGLREACDDPKGWTYVGWDWLINPELLKGRNWIDRWNSSKEWLFEKQELGGLGIENEEDVHSFLDDDRRSYQIYDSRDTPTQLGLFKTRIDLEDLLEGPIAEKRLLRFGSLFSGARLNLAKKENQDEYEKTFNGVVLANSGLESISNEVRDLLGSYVAVHARTGSNEHGSIFWAKSKPNMQTIFRRLTHSVLGIKAKEVDRMVDESTVRNEARRTRRSPSPTLDSPVPWEDDLEEDAAFAPSFESHLSPRSDNSPRASRGGHPAKPLSSSLHCRKPLWPSSDRILSRLNTPLYIATDSRSPSTEPSLRIFFDWFPCLFLLSDFASPTPGISDVSVSKLEELSKGGSEEWVSDFDGLDLGKFLFPFLEAEIAARGVEVVGTPGSTFSSYTSGILHEYYETRGMLAPWTKKL